MTALSPEDRLAAFSRSKFTPSQKPELSEPIPAKSTVLPPAKLARAGRDGVPYQEVEALLLKTLGTLLQGDDREQLLEEAGPGTSPGYVPEYTPVTKKTAGLLPKSFWRLCDPGTYETLSSALETWVLPSTVPEMGFSAALYDALEAAVAGLPRPELLADASDWIDGPPRLPTLAMLFVLRGLRKCETDRRLPWLTTPEFNGSYAGYDLTDETAGPSAPTLHGGVSTGAKRPRDMAGRVADRLKKIARGNPKSNQGGAFTLAHVAGLLDADMRETPHMMSTGEEDGQRAVFKMVSARTKSITSSAQANRVLDTTEQAYRNGRPAIGNHFRTLRHALNRVEEHGDLPTMVVYANDTLQLLQTNVALLVKLAKSGGSVHDPSSLPGPRSIKMEFDSERFEDSKLKAKALQKRGADAADQPKQKPPSRQKGCDGYGDKTVSKRASRRGTTANTKSQQCEKFAAGMSCIYWDQAAGRCPYRHARGPEPHAEPVSDDEAAKPAGGKHLKKKKPKPGM